MSKKRIITIAATLLILCIGGISAILFFFNGTPDIDERDLEIISEYKNNLKDPTSMRLYGDVLKMSLAEEGTVSFMFVCDAKNSYGGYGGKEKILAITSDDSDVFFMNEDDDDFLDLGDFKEASDTMVKSYEDGEFDDDAEKKSEVESLIENTTFSEISGEEVCEALDIEYFDY